jgi:hypothetical protein
MTSPDALTVACPICGNAAGDGCQWPGTGTDREPHQERVEAAVTAVVQHLTLKATFEGDRYVVRDDAGAVVFTCPPGQSYIVPAPVAGYIDNPLPTGIDVTTLPEHAQWYTRIRKTFGRDLKLTDWLDSLDHRGARMIFRITMPYLDSQTWSVAFHGGDTETIRPDVEYDVVDPSSVVFIRAAIADQVQGS